jgi:hypothetical protein
VGYALFFLTFFTVPLGLAEDSPLLVIIPILIWLGAIMFGSEVK